MKINRLMILRIILVVWIAIWLLYLIRPYFKKDLMGKYRTLISRPLEGKRSFATGDELYGFMTDCRDSILDERFTFSVAGLDDDALARCRLAYYLYPAVSIDDAEYVFVFKKSDHKLSGYSIFREFSRDKYILKKVK